jgi:hypothetical protein
MLSARHIAEEDEPSFLNDRRLQPSAQVCA